MSTPEDLIAQEQALREQLAEIQRKRMEMQRQREQEEAERKRQEEAQKPVVIEVEGASGGTLIIKNTYRDDVLTELRNTNGRYYRQDRNMIPIKEWADFLERVTKLPNVTVKYNGNTEKEIDWLLNAPPWLVEMDVRHENGVAKNRGFKIIQGPRTSAHIMHQIPGHKWDERRKCFIVPLTEGWRLVEVFKNIDGVVVTDEAQQLIEQQIIMRAQADKIATQEDAPDIAAALDRKILINGEEVRLGEAMYKFQRVGVKFVRDVTGGRALIADEMGLGKTWQAIGYALLQEKKRVLYVVPASLKNNWCREIRRLTGEPATVLYGAEPTKYDMVKLLTEPAAYTVINYDILGRKLEYDKETVDEQTGWKRVERVVRYPWAELLSMAKFDLIVFDEGHYIKNSDSNRSKACRALKSDDVIFLTGTPVLNRPAELWPMLTVIAPETFPSEEAFLTQYTVGGKSARNVEELRQLLRTIMIRRLKKDVVKELPPIRRIQEYYTLSERARKLYKKVEHGMYESVAEYSASGEAQGSQQITSILTQIMRLKQVCAIDKVDRTAELATELYDQTDETEARKVIIFTQFKAVAYAIAQRLRDQGVLSFVDRKPSGFVTAEQHERDQMVQRFQTDPNIRFLVATEKTMKEGHNATAAGHVIFNDLFWTPAGHEQAEGRAYGRLSNLHTINSYYMITDMDGDSIEEWIMELLTKKMKVITEVVEGVQEGRDESIVMELIEKLKNQMWKK